MLDGLVHDAKTQLYVLLGATSCVLLIACLNLANLLVARSASRRKETSIRAALGGSRLRLLREQVSESLTLAIAGGVLGLPLAWAGVRWLVLSRPDMVRVSGIHMDAGSILFGLGIMTASGVVAGLIPAATLLRSPLLEPLQETSRTNSASRGRARLRRILLAAEVGLTVVLLIGAGLLLKSYQHLRHSDLGCATQNVLTMHFSLPDARYGTSAKVSVWLGRATEEGRTALNSLRTSTTEKNDLASAFRRAIEECRTQSSMEASLSVVGEVSEMHPIVRDEVYRIGYEAIRNACVHSQATRLRVQLQYDDDLILTVRDNGVGIDSSVISEGKEGHFGLQGMRERADRIMAKLTVETSASNGTEIKLVIPGSIIYRKTRSGKRKLTAIKSFLKRMGLTSDSPDA